jgi:hypothetical protein
MNPDEVTFLELCQAPQLGAAVKALNEPRLAHMITWLRDQPAGGIRALVLGVAELEAVERFLKGCS